MEDNFKVLIYILFFAASIGASMYKNYVKKKEQEELRQRKIRNAQNIPSQENNTEPQPYKSPIPTTIEDFLKKQFEIELNSPPIENDFETEFAGNNSQLDTITEEGVAAFEETNATLLSDNFQDSDFSISAELNKQHELADISDDEAEAFKISVDDENSFNLQEAVIYSEILRRPYQ